MKTDKISMEKGGQKGFTLLEVMVAVSVLAIVLTAVYRLHSQTISMSASVRFYSVAPFLAQSKYSEIQMETEEEPVSDSGDFGDSFPGYSWSVNISEVVSEYLGESADNLRKIEVSVDYNEGEFVYDFMTYKLLETE